ncbi:MAG TPA: HAD family phosphatase [Opitutaceae bacterium]|nr:HAD family phosphatase [Opitutaceae bacterium]
MQLEIPPGDFAGFIFDLDGTLVDSMPLHYRAWNEAMKRAGLPHELDEELFYSLGGVPTLRVAQLMGEHYRLRLDPQKVFHEKEGLFLELQAELRLIEPVAAFARQAARRRPVSIASGGPRDIVHQTLRLTALAALFPVVITPEDVAFGKPAPDMFLLAAERMGVPARECLVFEDAEPGIAAARTAGMQYVRVPSRRASATGAISAKIPPTRSAAAGG